MFVVNFHQFKGSPTAVRLDLGFLYVWVVYMAVHPLALLSLHQFSVVKPDFRSALNREVLHSRLILRENYWPLEHHVSTLKEIRSDHRSPLREHTIESS